MKKLNYFLLCVVILVISQNMSAQTYFQQQVNYKIDVRLDDKNHELSAFETIEYSNNSPDELNFIYFHLWPNAYDNNLTALAKQKLEDNWQKLFNDEEKRGYIDSLDFKVNGKKVKIEIDKEYIDICKIILDEPLKSGGKITITTPFHVKIPLGVTSRLGHIDQSYQITQWYPKPAVYDKHGWHQMPYLNKGEFYSEFGSFDVSITVPQNYIVGATGDLQDQSEIDFLNNLAAETAKIDSFDKKDNAFPVSSEKMKTLNYKQSKIHDFAWFADKRFNVLKSKVKLPNSGRTVDTWAIFTNHEADLWLKANEYIKDAICYYSKWYGDYPYNNCTAVHSSLSAGGGMEYPNITVIGNTRNPLTLELVIMHEVGHNWFYGILGFNERRFTWMDEGINSFSENRYFVKKYPETNGFAGLLGLSDVLIKLLTIDELPFKKYHEYSYLFAARNNKDQQASLSAEEYASLSYGSVLYHKVARVFDYLLFYLGEEKFDKIMQAFYEEWKYKHPYPEDIKKAFVDGTGEDLDWLFEDLLKTSKKVDYKVCDIKNNKVLIKNAGMVNSPVSISGLKGKNVAFTEWHEGFAVKKWLEFPADTEIDRIIIDQNGDMLEFYRNNNTIKTKGLFKKVEPLYFAPLGIVENYSRSQISFSPVAGWNNYNGLMAGMSFFRIFIPQNKFEFNIMPMYSFGSKDLAGVVSLKYHIQPYNTGIREINILADASQFAYNNSTGDNFRKIKTAIEINFRNKYPRSKVKNKISLANVIMSNPDEIFAEDNPGYVNITKLSFIHNNRRAHNPYSVNTNIEIGSEFVKSSTEANYKILYNNKKGLNIRIFAGAFLYKSDNLSSTYNYTLSSASGTGDYMRDDIFLGRYEDMSTRNLFTNQLSKSDGAFATYTPHGQTNEWITSVNLHSAIPYLPKKIPLAVFANAAVFGNTTEIAGYNDLSNFAWEAGFQLDFGPLKIYLPIVMSEDLTTLNNNLTNNYFQRIRFALNLNALNPFELSKQIF